MDKNAIYSEILYLGFVFEKGRVNKKKWDFIYKKRLIKQIEMWKKVVLLMGDGEMTEKDVSFYKEFIALCESNDEMKKIYRCTYEPIKEYERRSFAGVTSAQDQSLESKILIKLLHDIICELVTLLMPSKISIPGEEIYTRLSALHNIPRFFGNQPNDVMNKIDFNTTIEYAFSNMNHELKEKYSYIYSSKDSSDI